MTRSASCLPDDQPGCAARRRSADRHDPHPAGATNVEDAKKFLAYMAGAEAQTKMNAAMGQLPINKDASVNEDDPFIKAGFELLSTTPGGIAQFFDRDAPAEMAKMGMEGFQEFMVKPDRLDKILERLEKARGRIYK